MPTDWKEIALRPETTIREALQNLDRSAMQIVLVTDPEMHLLGTVTDGDLRRALLKGATLDSRIDEAMNRRPSTGKRNENPLIWRQRMQRKSLRHLPIVDTGGRVVDLICEQREKPLCRPNPVVLMLGGLGMRLRPLTQTTPKPMLRVGDKPILETILEHVMEQGFHRFHFCINYLGEQIRQHFGDGSRWGVQIHYIEEKRRMGTAGALSLLKPLPELDLIVMNGDLLTKVDLGALLTHHQEHGNDATVCVREYQQQVPFGVMEMRGGRIERLAEKPVYRYFVNAGIYALSPGAVARLPKGLPYDMPQLLDGLIKHGRPVGGFPLTEYWLDIGRLPDFEQAQADFNLHFTRMADKEVGHG